MKTNIVTRAAESLAQYEASLGNKASIAINYDANPVGTSGGNVDFDAASNPMTGKGRLSGIEIIWADQTSTFISSGDLFADYDPDTDSYWSLVLDVTSSGVFDNAPSGGFTYDATEDLFEDDGEDPPVQTKYRFRLITQGVDSEGNSVNTPISTYGQYREVTTCINGEPFQRLTKVT